MELILIIPLFAGEDGMGEGANMHALEIMGLEIAEIRLRKLVVHNVGLVRYSSFEINLPDVFSANIYSSFDFMVRCNMAHYHYLQYFFIIYNLSHAIYFSLFSLLFVWFILNLIMD